MIAKRRATSRCEERTLLEADPITFSGAWMGMLYDLITEQGAELAADYRVATPARCFSVFLAISRNDPVSIADLARWHGFSHQLMRTRLAELESLHLIKSTQSGEDARKVVLRLTSAGKADLQKVEAVCEKARAALRRVFTESGLDPQALPRVAAALRRQSLIAR